ncbi:MAG: hypothetical protein HYR71_07610 [Chloroflexi bacterium]|nr:hypothetical protein [Chloroflexota bacterium]
MTKTLRRLQQFAQALQAEVQSAERLILSEYLDAAQRALFERMAVSDQRHSLDLLYALRDAGESDESVLQAALLHDLGKADAPLRLLHRVIHVVAGKALPGAWAAFCASPRRDWRHPFYVLACHAELGAQKASQAGCSAEVVALIRHHQHPITAQVPPSLQRKLRVLQTADGERQGIKAANAG